MAEMVRKHYRGCYRITLTAEHFGQMIKRPDGWHAEIRFANSGDLKRFAGIWSTRKDAIEELRSIRL